MKKKSKKPLSWSVKCSDCIEGMRKLEAGSVDFVFADPPYNIGCKYDEYDDKRKDLDYLEWSAAWMAEVHRVLKRHGTFWLAIGDEHAAALQMIARHSELLRWHWLMQQGKDFKGFHLRSWVVWFFSFGVACQKNFSRSHTHLFYFTKTKSKFTFNADEIRVPSARQLKYNDARANPGGKLPDNTWVLYPDALQECCRGDSDTWLASRVCGTFKERIKGAPNQMPQVVMERIVRATTNPGDLILDPFLGTGSTGEAALRLKRSFIGFDISKEYCQSSRKRLRGVIGGGKE